MESLFTAEFFRGNREALRRSVGTDDVIVAAANGLQQRGGDENYKFHQDSNFWYLTGLNAPDLVLVMAPQETFLIVPSLTQDWIAFNGGHDETNYRQRSDIQALLNERAGWQRLKTLLAQSRRVATPGSPPELLPRHGLYTSPVRRRLIRRLKNSVPGITIEDIRLQLARLRSVKQLPELQALQRAIDITSETLAEVRRPEFLRGITNEYELDAAISYGFRRRGADGDAFGSIVGAGAHSTTLHHMENNGPVKPGDFIVLDVGAEVEHYAADITRTICNQPLSKRQQAVFDAVEKVQKHALSLLKPGVMPIDYEKAVAEFMGTQLEALGLAKKPSRQQIRHYFPHATSHFLGLDTHDAGDYRAPYEPGMVITCEPGIYIPEEGIGVRLEDDVLITETGGRVLSANCSHQPFTLQ
jgi:Xaa-Pro aminopeptidase